MKRIVLIGVLLMLFANITAAKILIVYGEKATSVELNASKDLKHDIESVCEERVDLKPYSDTLNVEKYREILYVGTKTSNGFINDYFKNATGEIFNGDLEPETFILKSIDKNSHLIVGADIRGTFYGVYEFSKKVLDIDPNAYWIGYCNKIQNKISIPLLSYRAKAPVFPYRGYFDNDNDLLANLKGRKLIVELDLWKEMINTLMRMGYNYIDIHDLLGRPEYYLRDYYIQMTEFHTDLDLVNKVIDYAHSKGMMVQVPMYLGWEFKHLEMDEVCLTQFHDKWMEIYEYYLAETPLGKADLFLQRPRHPIYDWSYKCEEEASLGIKPGELMNKMFEGLYQLIQKYKPGAVLFCDLWQEGRPLWESGEFSPRKEIQMLWADHGYANFNEFPTDFKGYDFGVYIHAGVWKNNVTQSPYPNLIKEGVMDAIRNNATSNILVNGQTFKDFLLNISASAACAWDPVSFDPEQFYSSWTSRYFGENVSAKTVEVLKLTYEANVPIGGFRNTMKATDNLLKKMGRRDFQSESLGEVEASIKASEKALKIVNQIIPDIEPSKKMSFIDQVAYPTEIFLLNLKLLESAILLNNSLVNQASDRTIVKQKSKKMRNRLISLLEKLSQGSGWEKWDNFYNPENFRIHTPPPTIERVDRLIQQLRIPK
jgi:hypothetical protein